MISRWFSLLFLIFNLSISFSQRVVGYYPQWVQGNLDPSEIDYSVITHVNHAFAWPDEEGNILHYDDMISQSITSVVHDHGAKILLSLGGWGNSWGFASSIESEEARSILIDNIISICENNNYDGIDIDWEHPAGVTQKNNLSNFIAELRQAFDDLYPEWLISMAVPVSNWSGQHYDFNSLIQNVSYFNAMTYDFHGPWTSHAGHNSPLYPSPSNDPDGAVSTGIHYLTNVRNVPASKINMGLAFYGKEYNASTLNQPFSGDVISRLYNDYAPLINNGWAYNWDNIGQVPFLTGNNQDKVITIEDSSSISLKCEYARQNQLGGLMIWALSYDNINGNQVLINSIKNNYLSTIKNHFPDEFSIILKNYPNPFNSNTTLNFNIKKDSDVSLTIFDLKGNFVIKLIDKPLKVGSKFIKWDATNGKGEDVGAGVYIYQLTVNKVSRSNKMVYLK